METLGNKNQPKSAFKYYCSICDYGTCKKCNYDDHVLSAKPQPPPRCMSAILPRPAVEFHA